MEGGRIFQLLLAPSMHDLRETTLGWGGVYVNLPNVYCLPIKSSILMLHLNMNMSPDVGSCLGSFMNELESIT